MPSPFWEYTSKIGERGALRVKHDLERQLDVPVLELTPSSYLKRIQIQGGDLALNWGRETLFVEVKTEQEWTGNLCWEVWHCLRTRTKGWAPRLQGDAIAFVYERNGRRARAFMPAPCAILFRLSELRQFVSRWRKAMALDPHGAEEEFKVPGAYWRGQQSNKTGFWAVPLQAILNAAVDNRTWIVTGEDSHVWLGRVTSWGDFCARTHYARRRQADLYSEPGLF